VAGGEALSRTLLITGAAGEMGRRLCARLAGAGWQVRALVLPGDPLAAGLADAGCEIREGDVRDAASLAAAAAGAHTVFHLAAVILARDPALYETVNRQGTANMVAAAAAAGVRHFVYVSSASVVYPVLTPYGRSKLAAEEHVRAERRMAHTIVRPTLVYDGTGGQEFMLFVSFLRRFPVVPFIGPGTARKRPVLADDVVDGLARIAGNEAAYGKLYNLSGGEVITLEELGRLLLDRLGEPKPFVHLPVPLCRAVAGVLGAVLKDPPLTPYGIAGFVNHADLDPALAGEELGYRPLGVREGIARCFPAPVATSASSAPSATIRRSPS